MNKLLFSVGVASLTLVACSSMTSVRAATAGHVGCSPQEIEVGTTSYVDGADTWTAWCGGTLYYCARRNAHGSGFVFGRGHLDTTYSWAESTSCAPAASEPAIAQTPVPTTADSEAPRGAAGFTFKIDRAAAAKRCTDAGKEWRAIDDARATCSGVAASVGFEAATELAFCSGELCGVTLVAAPTGDAPGQWLLQYGGVRKLLEDKYGQVHTSSAGHDFEGCTGSALRGCMLDGRVRPETAWRWSSGESLSFVMGRDGSGVAMRLAYRDRSRRDDGNAL
jgi:hypothetical protein